MPEFVHLHNHSHYSLLDAVSTPEKLIEAAKKDGQKALALTDHGVMFGCFDFYTKAKKAGIKPILGFEAYIANGSRFDQSAGKSGTKKKNYFHLVLLAKNLQGYQNLMKLTTLAHTEGFYYKPRIDTELLEKYHEGIIALSACIAGVVNAKIVTGEYDEAVTTAKYYKDLFGDDFYMELQNHNLPDDKIILRDAPKIAKELDIKLVATNDVHYLESTHAIAHNVLLYIRDITAATAGTVDIYKLRYRTPEMYFKTQEQMNELFIDFPDAIANTVEIADKCDVTLDTELHMPQFQIPVESTAVDLDGYLDELTMKGLEERYKPITEEIRARTEYELGVIKKMGFPGYFLIVQDFILAAKKLGVRVGPGRGSAAGSVVAYALGITNVDPLKYDLLFERFLNPERVSMPDIDIDFADDKRDKVIEYVKQKYGEDSVAQIITFGQLSSRAVLTDVGRVLGVDLFKIKEITSKIPVVMGKVKGVAEAIELPELKWLKDNEDNKIKELVNYALLLEGVYRNTSTHAAGVVIAPGDISNYVPLYKPAKSKGQSVEIATQYSMKDLEAAGLLKMDFLGLRTLSILENTLAMIEKNHGIQIDLDAIDYNDSKSFELLSNGDTLAVFQFESNGMQEYLKQLKPKDLEEITAMNALYRPGPMANIPEFIDRKFGRKPITYLHETMEKSLKTTYGIIVYQEQVMQLVQDVAGFSLGQADILRRAMGKKAKYEMEKLHPLFIEGAKEKGIEEAMAEEIYQLIEKFADYGFNKSHSLAYSYLAFQTVWLKAHYTGEFLAANMSAELNDQDKIVQLIEEAKKFDITVMPPDVNRSDAEFTALGKNIIFGMAAIKNVGVSAVESIMRARKEKAFSSFFDFMARVDTKQVNKRALEALVCAGAFDLFQGTHRAALFNSIESALDYAHSYQESKNTTMDSLFGGGNETSLVEPPLQDVAEWSERERLEKEKEYLNFYISGHPLNRYKPFVESLATLQLGNKNSEMTGGSVRVCGIISSIRTRYDKKQNPIAFVQLEDFSGRAECILWSKAYAKYQSFIELEAPVMFIGKIDSSQEELKIVVDEVISLEEGAERFSGGYNIFVDLEKTNITEINEFYKLCSDNTKKTVNFIVFDKSRDYKTVFKAEEINISLSEKSVNAIVDIFGRQNVRIMDRK